MANLRIEIFPSDLTATIAFYVRVLRFTLVGDDRAGTDPYVSLRRDSITIGAALRKPVSDLDQRRPPTGVEIVIEVEDVDAEHDRVHAEHWPCDAELTERPWGLRDFRVLDPSGYYLRITGR